MYKESYLLFWAFPQCWKWTCKNKTRCVGLTDLFCTKETYWVPQYPPVSPVSSAFTHPTSMWLSSSSASAICTASSQSDVCLSLSSSSVFFLASSVPVFMQHWLHFTMVSAPPLSPRLRPPPLRQFYYSMWWCSLHWQISGDGSLEGNDDTVRQPLSSTACNHLLKDSTSCDMQ